MSNGERGPISHAMRLVELYEVLALTAQTPLALSAGKLVARAASEGRTTPIH